MKTNLAELSSKSLRRLANLVERKQVIQSKIDEIVGDGADHPSEPKPEPTAKPGKRHMSAAAKRKISLAAKRRWRLAKAEGKKNL